MVLTCFLKKSQQGWVMGKGRGMGLPFACDSTGQATETVWCRVSEAGGVKDAGDRRSDVIWGVSRTLPFQQSVAAETKWWWIIFSGYGAFPRNDVQQGTVVGKNTGCATAPRRAPGRPRHRVLPAEHAGAAGDKGCNLQLRRLQVPGGTHRPGPTSDCVPCPQQPRGKSRACPEGQGLVRVQRSCQPTVRGREPECGDGTRRRKHRGVPACNNYARLLAVLQCSRSWAPSW